LDDKEREAAIRGIARQGDPDRYAASLFAPRAARDDLVALYAFNVELARVGEQVKEPQLGEIRLQWWRDALDSALAGEATPHPVIEAVVRTARAHDLAPDALHGLIDARHFDVSTKIMPDHAALDAYLDQTAGALFRLAAAITGAAGPLGGEAIEPASRVAGLAYGLTGLMRAMPVHASLGRVDMPADALIRRGTSPGRVLIGEVSQGLLEELKTLRDRASEALHAAVPRIARLHPSTQSAFLPLALVGPYLTALETGDPLREIAGINPLYRLWRLGIYKFRNAV
jgi:phytoene synthase